MSKGKINLLIFFFVSHSLLAKVYPGPGFDKGKKIINTFDGGYILCGDYWNSNIPNSSDVYVLKLDSTGNTEWIKIYSSGIEDDYAMAIVQIADSGYIVGGHFALNPSNPTGGPRNLGFILRMNSNGDSLWTKTYSTGAWSDEICYIDEKPNGNLVLCNHNDDLSDNNNLFYYETDQLGNILQTKLLNYYSPSPISEFGKTNDNGYIVASNYVNNGDPIGGTEITKIDSMGNLEYTHIYPSDTITYTSGYAVCETDSLQNIVVGVKVTCSNYMCSEFYYQKIDSAGNIIWTKNFAINDRNWLVCVKKLSNGFLAAAGNMIDTLTNKCSVFFMKFDSQGDTIWTQTLNGPGSNSINFFEPTRNNGFIMIGDSVNGGTFDIWINLLDSNGISIAFRTVNISDLLLKDEKIRVFPNPFTNSINIELQNKISNATSFKMFELTGKLVYEDVFSGQSLSVKSETIAPGYYIYRIDTDQQSITGKIIKQ